MKGNIVFTTFGFKEYASHIPDPARYSSEAWLYVPGASYPWHVKRLRSCSPRDGSIYSWTSIKDLAVPKSVRATLLLLT